MHRRATLALAATLATARPAAAQPPPVAERLLGAWLQVAVTAERADGSRDEPFGPDPKGIIIFTPEGRFSLFQSRAQVPRIASNDRATATAEEAQGVMRSAIAYYGSFSVNETDATLLLAIEGSTLANLVGSATQRRLITLLTADELRFTNPRTPAGVTLHTVWKRARPG